MTIAAMFDQFVHLFANGISFALIYLAGVVLYLWSKPTMAALTSKPIKAEGWFIMGVFFGFLSIMLDNIYWLIPWSLVYIESFEMASYMTGLGIYFNIFFRMGLGLISAYCHIKSAYMHSNDVDGNQKIRKTISIAILLGIVFSAILHGFR